MGAHPLGSRATKAVCRGCQPHSQPAVPARTWPVRMVRLTSRISAFRRPAAPSQPLPYHLVNHSFGPRWQNHVRNARVRARWGLVDVTTRQIFTYLAGLLPLAVPATSFAAPAIALNSAVFVERTTQDSARSLEPASRLNPGDRVVYIVNWHRLGGSGGFVVTNPLPPSVYYQGSANGDEEVSVDGGRSWGRLSRLRIGNRFATPEDVTHVRWRVGSQHSAAGSGRIAYSAIVR